jgi:hypothetical protein
LALPPLNCLSTASSISKYQIVSYPDRAWSVCDIKNWSTMWLRPEEIQYEPRIVSKFRSDLILGLATRGQKLKTQKCYDSWTNNDWIILKFLSDVYLVHVVRIHDIIHRFFIWPTFEGRRESSKRHR